MKTAFMLRIFVSAYILITTHMVSAQDAVFQQQLKLANKGNAAAQNYVGESYAYGADKVKGSYEKAEYWLSKSAAQGYVPAIYMLGVLRDDISLVSQAAEQGNVDALLRLARKYEMGLGVTVDRKKALELCLKAAEQPHPAAYDCVAYNFESKDSNDIEREIILVLRSIQIGNFNRAITLRMINESHGQIFQKLFQRIKSAADLNDASAQLIMATIYYYSVLGKSEGNGLQAERWAFKSANQGYIPGQNFLGKIYEDGFAVPRDFAKAESWYDKGARMGDHDAIRNLRNLLAGNNSGEKYSKFKKLVEQDDQISVHHLNRQKSLELIQLGIDFGLESKTASAPVSLNQTVSVITPQPNLKPIPSLSQNRVALVIGNSVYQNFSKLANPGNDAIDMAARLRQLGFSLIGGGANLDLSQQQMAKLVGDFGASLKKNDLAIFYFAGHGAQVDGSNYLIPVNDASIAYQEDIRSLGFNVSHVLQSMEERQEGTNILILDACRNNPLPSRRAGRSADTRGLAKMQGNLNTVVMYAAKPGQAALDGTGRNGVFTGALLSALKEPGLELTQVFRRVVKNVDTLTKRDQTPWMEGATTDDIYLIGMPTK